MYVKEQRTVKEQERNTSALNNWLRDANQIDGLRAFEREGPDTRADEGDVCRELSVVDRTLIHSRLWQGIAPSEVRKSMEPRERSKNENSLRKTERGTHL
jgi:hypothetical protein